MLRGLNSDRKVSPKSFGFDVGMQRVKDLCRCIRRAITIYELSIFMRSFNKSITTFYQVAKVSNQCSYSSEHSCDTTDMNLVAVHILYKKRIYGR